MNAITKLFVVLLVICSLLLVAAEIVFVNRTEDYKKQLTTEQQAHTLAKVRLEAAQNMAQSLQANLASARASSDARVADLDKDLLKERLSSAAKDTAIAEVKRQLQVAQAQGTSQTEQIGNLNNALKNLDVELKRITAEKDKLSLIKGDLDMKLAQVVKELTSLYKKTELLTEENTQAKVEIQDLRARLGSAAVSSNAAPKAAGAISGKIRDVKNVNGLWYATITIGASDHVEKGMQFKIVNDGNFMGLLTVDHVEANEAFGRVQGSNPGAIRRDMKVDTQL